MVLYGNVMIALRPTISDKVRLSIQLASWGLPSWRMCRESLLESPRQTSGTGL